MQRITLANKLFLRAVQYLLLYICKNKLQEIETSNPYISSDFLTQTFVTYLHLTLFTRVTFSAPYEYIRSCIYRLKNISYDNAMLNWEYTRSVLRFKHYFKTFFLAHALNPINPQSCPHYNLWVTGLQNCVTKILRHVVHT